MPFAAAFAAFAPFAAPVAPVAAPVAAAPVAPVPALLRAAFAAYRAAVRDVTLPFDVPQTDPAAEPFKTWQAAAQALAGGMDAAVVDDNGQPLSDEGFAAIGKELATLYDALRGHELAAGSAPARRLFS